MHGIKFLSNGVQLIGDWASDLCQFNEHCEQGLSFKLEIRSSIAYTSESQPSSKNGILKANHIVLLGVPTGIQADIEKHLD